MSKSIYPKLFIKSKNELAKHISQKDFPPKEALDLINDCLLNFDSYWKDSASSELKKGKYIRNASGKSLKKLHRKINALVLAPHDKLVPFFIFGGLKKRDHVMAARELLGSEQKRCILKLDLKRFFEQVESRRVEFFFRRMCKCSSKASKILTALCCVPVGPKGSGGQQKTIARGFATSPRLAVWCNLNLFLKLQRLVLKRLKGHDPRIAVYVDDIGITASRVSKEEMGKLGNEIAGLLAEVDPNQPLRINEKKTSVRSHRDGMHYVGIELRRDSLAVGIKARAKKEKIKDLLNTNLPAQDRKALLLRKKAMNRYKNYVEKSLKH